MKRVLAIHILFVFCTSVNAQVYQFRGPNRDGMFQETALLKEWPPEGPGLLLEIDGLGAGYSSPVVYNNTIFVTGTKDTLDVIAAFDFEGNKKWEKAYGRAWPRTYSDNRCTPTIESGRVYLCSGSGEISCWDAEKGTQFWLVDAHTKYSGEYHRWGIAESVLLTDEAVIYTTGGEETSVVALSKENGGLVWKTKSLGGTRAYASSSLVEFDGLKLILEQTANDLMAVNAKDGEIFWSYPVINHHLNRSGTGANTNTPLFYGDEIFVTSGYDHPGLMFKLARNGKSAT